MSTPAGAVQEFINKEFGGFFQPLSEIVTVGTAAVEVVPNNPDRVSLLIMNIGTTQISLRPLRELVFGDGIFLGDAGAVFTTNARDDAVLPALPFFAAGDLAGGELFVIQIVREAKS